MLVNMLDHKGRASTGCVLPMEGAEALPTAGATASSRGFHLGRGLGEMFLSSKSNEFFFRTLILDSLPCGVRAEKRPPSSGSASAEEFIWRGESGD